VNLNVEELLRDGMERFTIGVAAPGGLAVAAAARRRRRLTIRAAAIGGTIAVAVAVAVAVMGVTGVAAGTAVPTARARLTAYFASRVESAVSQNLVSVATSGNLGFPMVTYAYGPYYDWIQYNPTKDYRDRIVNGKHLWDFPPAERGQPNTAQGVSLIDGKLYGVYVTYDDDRYSLTPVPKSWPSSVLPKNACSTTARLEMGSVPIIGVSWPEYIDGTLKCGDAFVSGNVRIKGQETTEITGKPITVPLSAGYAKSVSEKYATVTWRLYVNPVTYLPVRIYGSTDTYGGKAGNEDSAGMQDVAWLKPTAANIAKAQVTIPRGFHLYTGSQQNQ
jgi:hypothetical protein